MSPLAGACLLAGGLAPEARAKIIDNFDDNVKTGWTDFTFGAGSSTESGGRFNFSLPNQIPQSLFFASTKATETYTLEDGKAIELRCDLVSVSNPHSYAVLGWTPNSQNVSSLAGYSLAVTSDNILITKGINKYFHDENVAIKTDNVQLVLMLAMAGGNVTIHAQIRDKDNANAILFDKTYVDTPAADIFATGSDNPAAVFSGPGKLTLIDYADKDASVTGSYDVVFDNAEGFQLETAVVDNFDDNTKTAWADASFGIGKSEVVGGQFKFTLPHAQDIFFGSSKTTRDYEILDGEKLEFRVDRISASRDDAFAVLAWIPNSQDVKSLAGYGLTLANGGFLMSKGINRYFFELDPPAKTENVTMSLTLERRGASMFFAGRIYDKDANNALIFERSFVDTAEADIMSRGTDSPAAPFTGPGKFVLILYEDFNQPPSEYQVIYDNAWAASAPVQANVPPSLSEFSPENYKNFVSPTANFTFKISDDKPVPAAGVAVTLNGTRHTTANGLTVTPAGNTATVSLGGLAANKNYVAEVESTDADSAISRTTIYFDTFAKNNLVIEAEDYNFDGGSFIDNPVLVAVDAPGEPNSYRYQAGLQDYDLNNTRTTFGGPYRGDAGTQVPTLDFERDPFVAAGGKAAGFVDYDNARIRTGEWQRYTRTFPAGTYQVYLRQCYFNVPNGEVILEKVNGDPSDPAAPVETLGSFIGFNSGAQYRNAALTDAAGVNVAPITLDGLTTLRLRQVTPEPGDGDIFQNYLIFIPTAAVINRPKVALLSPAARSTVNTAKLQVHAELQDRDTTVNEGSVELFLNNAKVPATVNFLFGSGITTVDYTVNPLPASGSTVAASLRFTDSSGTRVTNDWSFTITYFALNPDNRGGSGSKPGFNVRVVQAPAGSNLANTLTRAEEQLAANSPIAKAFDVVVESAVINYNQNEGASDGHFPGDLLFPGLDTPEAQGNDDMAMEATAYLDLPAGAVRFGVLSDDGFKLSSGAGLHDQTPVIDFRSGGTADQQVDVVVPQAGLYPFRLVWYERGGGAQVEFFTVNAAGERTLVNDPNVAGSIKAYRMAAVATEVVKLYSGATIDGAFTEETSAAVNTGAKTVSVVAGGATKFYLLRSSLSAPIKIKTIATSGGTVQMTYGAP